MNEKKLFGALLNFAASRAKFSLFLLDKSGEIQKAFMGEKFFPYTAKLEGKNLPRLAQLLLSADNFSLFNQSWKEAAFSNRRVEIRQLDHQISECDHEYYRLSFEPYEDSGQIFLYISNITETVLLTEEFTTVTQGHESVQRELYQTMSQMDLELMDLSQTKQKFSALYQIMAAAQRHTDYEVSLQEIMTIILTELHYEEVGIFLKNPDDDNIRLQWWQGGTTTQIRPESKEVAALAAEKQDFVFRSQMICQGDSKAHTCFPTGKEMGLPLFNDLVFMGVLYVQAFGEQIFKDYDQDLFRSIAVQVAALIHSGRTRQEQDAQ